jgi:Molybdopterin oxidoreductase
MKLIKNKVTLLSLNISNNKCPNLLLNGALTGRPYPFTIRVWEHIYKASIDSTDGFGQSLRAGIAYDKIRRLLPNLTTNEEDTPWINDRTRFSFEGLPSGTILKSVFVKRNKNKKKLRRKLTEIILLLFYFYDHLNTHIIETSSFILVFGTSISLELISLLLFTFYKYSFLKLKTAEVLPQNNDLESGFQLNSSSTNLTNLLKSDLCLFIGVNTRHEGSYLNLKIRKRYLKSNFNIVSLSSLLDLTFPVFLLGSTLKVMSSILEGNSLVNQLFKNSNHPIVMLNSDYFRRIDNKNCNIFIETLKSYTSLFTKNWNGLNILNYSLNNVGANILNRFPAIQPADLVSYNTLYFFNTPLYIFSLKKLLELRVLNYLIIKTGNKIPKVAIYQSSSIENSSWFTKTLKKNESIRSCFYVPTENFYNNFGTYVNTEGFFKKSSSIIVSKLSLKNDWRFLRRIFKYTKKKIWFTKDIKNKQRIFFRSKNPFKFKNYLALHLFPVKIFTRLMFYQLSENKPFFIKTSMFFFLLSKTFNTKIKFWLQDFYLGNRDLYSRHSKTMVKCSAYLKVTKLNFVIN